jgi:hypothetical protein
MVCVTEAAGLGVLGVVICWAVAEKEMNEISSNCVAAPRACNFLILLYFG